MTKRSQVCHIYWQSNFLHIIRDVCILAFRFNNLNGTPYIFFNHQLFRTIIIIKIIPVRKILELFCKLVSCGKKGINLNLYVMPYTGRWKNVFTGRFNLWILIFEFFFKKTFDNFDIWCIRQNLRSNQNVEKCYKVFY